MTNIRAFGENHKVNAERLFFAIKFDDALNAKLSAFIEKLAQEVDEHALRWLKSENFHITLRFLGMVSALQKEEIITALPELIGKILPFDLRLGKLLLFPNTLHPKCLALKVLPGQPLLTLAKILGQLALKHNCQQEKYPFTPHITLGRFKHSPDFDFTQLPVHTLQCLVREIYLLKSDVDHQGASYSVIGQWPL